MPIFEYQCTQCETTFEQFTQRAKDGQVPACPRCGADRAERVFSGFAMQAGTGSGCGSATGGGGG
jgi:putative FmdB family regulatory protein